MKRRSKVSNRGLQYDTAITVVIIVISLLVSSRFIAATEVLNKNSTIDLTPSVRRERNTVSNLADKNEISLSYRTDQSKISGLRSKLINNEARYNQTEPSRNLYFNQLTSRQQIQRTDPIRILSSNINKTTITTGKGNKKSSTTSMSKGKGNVRKGKGGASKVPSKKQKKKKSKSKKNKPSYPSPVVIPDVTPTVSRPIPIKGVPTRSPNDDRDVSDRPNSDITSDPSPNGPIQPPSPPVSIPTTNDKSEEPSLSPIDKPSALPNIESQQPSSFPITISEVPSATPIIENPPSGSPIAKESESPSDQPSNEPSAAPVAVASSAPATPSSCISSESSFNNALEAIPDDVSVPVELTMCVGTITIKSEINLSGKTFTLTCDVTNSTASKTEKPCIISGERKTRLFRGGPSFASFVGIQLTQGRAQQGSIMYLIGGTLSLTDCVLSNSTAADGGALYVDAESTLLMDTCVFYQNSAENGAGVYTVGGTLRSSGVTFISNFASLDGGAISFQNNDAAIAKGVFAGNTAQKGGAIAVIGGTTLSILSDTTFFNNAAILNGDDIFIDNSGQDTQSTVTCASRGVTFCNGIDARSIYEGIPDSTDCNDNGIDGSNASDTCATNLQ